MTVYLGRHNDSQYRYENVSILFGGRLYHASWVVDELVWQWRKQGAEIEYKS